MRVSNKSLQTLFSRTAHPIIGMIHFPPLIGYKGYPGFESIRKKTLSDVRRLHASGVHAIMLENNYDIPHSAQVPPEVGAMCTALALLVREHTNLPIGANILWNDYKTAFGLAATAGISFIRISAFVDDVMTSFGPMYAIAKETVAYRKRLKLEHVAILADVHVKHSTMMDPKKSLTQSVREAVRARADGIIITGTWTGVAPKLDDLDVAKKGGLPVFVGSGSTPENIGVLLEHADSIIVGSAIMTDREIDPKKLSRYIKALKSCCF